MKEGNPYNVIVVLGSENCDQGILSHMARSRVRAAVEISQSMFGDTIFVPTGGRGPHFNLSERRHAGLLADYLSELGVPRGIIVPIKHTSNTVQDLMAAREVLQELQTEHEISQVTAVTSDYHSDRVRLILDTHFYEGFRTQVIEAKTEVDRIGIDKYLDLVTHEQLAIQTLVEKQGGLMWEGELHPFLSISRQPDVTSWSEVERDATRAKERDNKDLSPGP